MEETIKGGGLASISEEPIEVSKLAKGETHKEPKDKEIKIEKK